MSINNSILLATGLTDTNFKFTIFDDESFNYISHHKRDNHPIINYVATLDVMPERCSNCGKTQIYRNGTERSIVTLPNTTGLHQIVRLDKMRYKCTNCNSTFMAQSPDLVDNSKLSRPVLLEIIDLARQDISVKSIANILKLSHTTVHNFINSAADNYQIDFNKQLPPVICIDEVQYKKKHYGFEMANGETSEFIEIFPERTNRQIRRYLRGYSLQNRQGVRIVVTDMNANYMPIIREMFPNAIVIVDRFHTVQLAMKAVQSVRVGYQHTLDKQSRVYKILKSNWRLFVTKEAKYDLFGHRWFFGVNHEAVTIDVLQEVYETCPLLKSACEAYQAIMSALDNRNPEEFLRLLRDYKPNKSAMDTVIRTYKKYKDAIVNSFKFRASNGRIEGLNRRIKQIKRTGYGYARTANFFFRIRLQLMNKEVLQKKFTDLMLKK
jgi:transposase